MRLEWERSKRVERVGLAAWEMGLEWLCYSTGVYGGVQLQEWGTECGGGGLHFPLVPYGHPDPLTVVFLAAIPRRTGHGSILFLLLTSCCVRPSVASLVFHRDFLPPNSRNRFSLPKLITPSMVTCLQQILPQTEPPNQHISISCSNVYIPSLDPSHATRPCSVSDRDHQQTSFFRNEGNPVRSRARPMEDRTQTA